MSDHPITAQRLSKADAATLRRIAGVPTLQDWLDHPSPGKRGPWHPDAQLRLIMAVRVAAQLQAQTLARVAPWLLVPPVVRP